MDRILGCVVSGFQQQFHIEQMPRILKRHEAVRQLGHAGGLVLERNQDRIYRQQQGERGWISQKVGAAISKDRQCKSIRKDKKKDDKAAPPSPVRINPGANNPKMPNVTALRPTKRDRASSSPVFADMPWNREGNASAALSARRKSGGGSARSSNKCSWNLPRADAPSPPIRSTDKQKGQSSINHKLNSFRVRNEPSNWQKYIDSRTFCSIFVL